MLPEEPPSPAALTCYSHALRDELATPLAGKRGVKDSKNPLLFKPQLGLVKATAYNLPDDFTHSFGKPNIRNGETAGLVVNNWAQADTKSASTNGSAKNFRALNKAAILDGYLDPRSVREFHKTHDIRISHEVRKRNRLSAKLADMQHGKPSARTGTNTMDLVNHTYRFEWMDQKQREVDSSHDGKFRGKPKQTKTSLLLAKKGEQVRSAGSGGESFSPPKFWKMKQFSGVSSKVFA